MAVDEQVQTILDALKLYYRPGEVVELRALNMRNGPRTVTASGYYDDMEKLARQAAALDGLCSGIYVTMNRVDPDLIARRNNRLETSVAGRLVSTSKDDIIRRTHLLIDIDPVRPAGISSTDREMEYALGMGDRIRGWLRDLGWPGSIKVMTGSGAAVVYEIDLSNDQESEKLVKDVLKALHLVMSDEHAHVDISVVDPSRVFKLPGTTACKGDNTMNRPHRRSYIATVDNDIKPVPTELMRELARLVDNLEPSTPKTNKEYTGPKIDADYLVSRMGLRKISSSRINGGEISKLNACPWNSSHDGAFIIQYDNGWVRVGCPHHSCGGPKNDRTKELLEKHIPGWKARKPKKPVLRADIKIRDGETGGEYSLDDYGNGRRFGDRFKLKLKYVPQQKTWYEWTGKRWRPGITGDQSTANRYADMIICELRAEAGSEPDKALQKTLWNHVFASSSARGRAAVVSIGRDYMIASPEDFDRDDMLFNCDDGTVDLHTGIKRDHNRDDLITRLVPTKYDETATCPKWLGVVKRATGDDQELLEYLQRVLGYCLCGVNTEKSFFVLFGPRDTGKSLVMNTVSHVMGDYCVYTTSDTFLLSSRGGETGGNFELARLTKARLIITPENADGRRFNDSLIKAWTGRDRMMAAGKFQVGFEFMPKGTLVFYTNYIPSVAGGDGAMIKRFKPIPFIIQIPDAEQMLTLQNDLKAEAAGIFNWLVDGCLQWQKHGLPAPQAVQRAVDEFKLENDQISTFISECVDTVKDGRETSGDMWKAYKVWCEHNGERYPVTERTLTKKLKERGLRKSDKRGANGYVHWLDTRLKPEYNQTAGYFDETSMLARRRRELEIIRAQSRDVEHGAQLSQICKEMQIHNISEIVVINDLNELAKCGQIFVPDPNGHPDCYRPAGD